MRTCLSFDPRNGVFHPVGGLIMNDTFWLGVGARHLNRPNISFEYNGNEKLDIFLSVQAGFSYQLDNVFYTWDSGL